MAKIWFCKEGDRPTVGGPIAERPLSECVRVLDVRQDFYLGDDPKKVRFGTPGDPMNEIRGNKHVVVEVEESESSPEGWAIGYYYSPLSPEEAYEKLGLG